MITKTHGLIAFFQIFVALSVLYLIVGLIKPKWVWLGEEAPGRQVIVAIALVMFMASWTGYSHFALKAKREAAQEAVQIQSTLPEAAPAPVVQAPVTPTAPVAAAVATGAAAAAKAATAAKAPVKAAAPPAPIIPAHPTKKASTPSVAPSHAKPAQTPAKKSRKSHADAPAR